MHSFYRLPPIDMIPGPQAYHPLHLVLLHSGILHIKMYTHWNETETKQLQTVVKLFCISFVSTCRQFKPLVSYFSFVSFIIIFFNDILTHVRYCISNFVTREFRIAYRPTRAGACADPCTVGGGVRTDLGRRRRRADYFCTVTAAACQILSSAAAAFGGVVTP